MNIQNAKNHTFRQLLFILFLSVLSQNCFSQTLIHGVVKDGQNTEPLKFVTVYIDGTTIGTISNVDGKFGIDPLYFPCKLIVSHIGYKRQVISLNEGGSVGSIYLEKKKERIDEIIINADNKRADNLEEFRESFLGTDKWGKKAKIENEEGINFSREKEMVLMKNGKQKETSTLLAISNTPLEIDLPELAYTLHADILQTRSNERFESRLAYYYYKPKEGLRRRQKRTIQKNRKQAFYNSSMHLLRSLFQGKTMEQGYLIIEASIDDSTGVLNEVEIDLTKNLKPLENGKVLCGLKNKKYAIWYIHNSRREPLNLTRKKHSSFGRQLSIVHFLNDSCLIRQDGTTPDLSIRFEGTIANKKAGAALPSNYSPD